MESVALTVIGKLPATVGVPLSVPFEASVTPAGRVLAVVKTIAPVPPLAVKLWL